MVCSGEMGSIVDKKSWYEEDTKSQRKPTKKYDSLCQQAYQRAKKGKDKLCIIQNKGKRMYFSIGILCW